MSRASRARPAANSARVSSEAARVGRGTMLVRAIPSEGRRASSSQVKGTEISRAAWSSRQNGLPGPAK